MNGKTARTVLVGLLCILALSVAAATIESPTTVGEGGSGVDRAAPTVTPSTGTPAGTTADGPPDRGGNQSAVQQVLRPAFCIPALRNPVVLLGLVALITAAVGALAYRNDFTVSVVTITVAGLGPATFLVLALSFTLGGCQPPSRQPETNGSAPREAARGATGTGGPPGETAVTAPPEVTLLLVALVAVAVVVALAVFVRGTGDDDPDRGGDDDEGTLVETGAIADIASAAGEAADRIEASGAVDNEVYRAWREMTRHLDADRPASSTPAEFREAAVDAGMDPDDVDELTALFEEVRYGGYEATADRERRAVEALRRIESTYGGGDRP